jgi:hypothetical protein
MILLTLPRSGSHLMAQILKCGPVPTMKVDGWVPEEDVVNKIESKGSFWFHYPYVESVRQALQESQEDKYLLLRDPRAIIVSWAYYCEEPDSPLDFIHKDKYLHTYPLKKRIDLIINHAYSLLWDYEKWRQSGMFTVLRYRDIVFNPLARTAFDGFRSGVVGNFRNDMTDEQMEKCSRLYGDLIANW